MQPSPSPYAPRPARSQVRATTPLDPGLLPVSMKCTPHLRQPCILRARADYAEWDTETRNFLPVLDVIPLRAGAQGVDRQADGGLMTGHLAAGLEASRWRVLVNGSPVLNDIVPDGKFLVEYACERRLIATVPFWETPQIVSRDSEMKWAVDAKARRDFIAMCVAARLIEPITVEACRAVLHRESGTLQELSTELRSRKGQVSPELEADVRRREIRVAHMEARLAGEDPFGLEAEPAIQQARGKARRLDAPPETIAALSAGNPTALPIPAPPVGTVTLAEAQAMAEDAAQKAVAAAIAAMRAAPAPPRKPRTPKPAVEKPDAQ